MEKWGLKRNELFGFLIVALPFLFFWSQPVAWSMFVHWVNLGKEIFHQHSLFPELRYLYTPHGELMHINWLLSCFYFLIYKAGGLLSIGIIHRFVVAGILIFLVQKSGFLKKKFSTIDLVITMVALFAFSECFLDRPEIFGILFFLLVFERIVRDAPLGITFLFCVLWANLHASALLIPVLLLRKVKTKHFWILSSALLLNPFSIKLLNFTLTTFLFAKSTGVSSWKPIWAMENLSYLLTWLGLGSIVFLKKKNFSLMLLFFLPLAGVRFISYFALAFLLMYLKDLPEMDNGGESKKGNILLVSVISLFIIFLSPGLKESLRGILPDPKTKTFEVALPESIIVTLKGGKKDRVFSEAQYGAIFPLETDHQINMDWVNTLYSREQMSIYMNVLKGEDMNYFCNTGIGEIVLRNNETPLFGLLKNNPTWISQPDKDFTLFSKDDPCAP